MQQELSIPTDNFPAGTVIDIPWAPGKRASDAVNTAAELITGTGGGKIARKVAVQSTKLSLGAQMRKLESGGRLIVVIPSPAEGDSKDEGTGRLLMIRASVKSVETSEITSPQELKAELASKVTDPVQYLHHATLGYGGRAAGISQENNVESHQVHYGFIDPSQTTITLFDASVETSDGAGLTKGELEVVAEVVKRSSLGSGESGPVEALLPEE